MDYVDFPVVTFCFLPVLLFQITDLIESESDVDKAIKLMSALAEALLYYRLQNSQSKPLDQVDFCFMDLYYISAK